MSSTPEADAAVEQLKAQQGAGTELVTVAVPPDTSLRSLKSRLVSERADAERIKSDSTRRNVRAALGRTLSHLSAYESVPPCGLIIYAGVVGGELVSHVYDDLPSPVAKSLYRCDNQFDPSPIEQATQSSEAMGLLIVERGEAIFARLAGNSLRDVHTIESRVMGSSRAGGQSAERFARERERQCHEFFKKVSEAVSTAFLSEPAVTHLAVGGTLDTAKRFVSGEYLHYELRDRLVGTYSAEYATEQGLWELADHAATEFVTDERRHALEALNEFFSRIRDDAPVAYGSDSVDKATEYGAVDVGLLSTSLPKSRRTELTAAIEQYGGCVHLLGQESTKEVQFEEGFGGVGALLRYPVG